MAGSQSPQRPPAALARIRGLAELLGVVAGSALLVPAAYGQCSERTGSLAGAAALLLRSC